MTRGEWAESKLNEKANKKMNRWRNRWIEEEQHENTMVKYENRNERM